MNLFKKNWILLIVGSFFSLFYGNLLLVGSDSFYKLVFNYPLIYSGDGLYTSWGIQRIIEGWLFENARNGFPFGSQYYDYPGSDIGSLAAFKILGVLKGDWVFVLNSYIYIGFILNFIVSFFIFKKFSISAIYAFTGALIFNFIPFHTLRLPHLMYTWYFVVPVFFYLGYQNFNLTEYKKLKLAECFLIIFLGFFGVYYAVFGTIVLVFSGVLSYLKSLNIKVFIRPLVQVCLVFIAVLVNLIPNLIYFYINGRNTEFQSRGVGESEVYAFKLRHLLFPRGDHEFRFLSKFNGAFDNGDGLNAFYSIEVTPGLFGSLSILMLGIAIICMINRKFFDEKLKFLAIITWVLILFGISGGFGSFFAFFISPQIRAWDRISVFISFGAILGGIYFLNKYTSKSLQSYSKYVYCIFPIAILIISIVEQSNYKRLFLTQELKNQFKIDKSFFTEIEAVLKPGAAVYQLPYVPFPEVAGVLGVGTYDFAKGLLHSKNLKWSLGSTRGRGGDKFFKSLESESIDIQVETVKSLGYSGIYIDRRGYSDNGDKKIEEISKFLGYGPNLFKGDGKAVFFIISK